MGILYILGSGTPTPTGSRFGTSYVLGLNEDYLMFDCGPASTHKLVKMGLLPTQINYLFFTHHHFDHNSDYPCFLLSRWDQSIGKEKKLKIFGPVPTENITETLIGPDGAFSYDWKARVGHRLSMSVYENRGGLLPRPPPSFDVKDVSPKTVIKGEKWSVKTASVVHVQPFLESLAYRVDSNDGSVVFTGDTEPCKSVVDLAVGADSLVVNCWDHQEIMDANGEALGQTGTLGAAKMARESGVKKLFLTHTGSQLSSPRSKEKGMEDIRSIYKGEIIFCEELMKICLW